MQTQENATATDGSFPSGRSFAVRNSRAISPPAKSRTYHGTLDFIEATKGDDASTEDSSDEQRRRTPPQIGQRSPSPVRATPAKKRFLRMANSNVDSKHEKPAAEDTIGEHKSPIESPSPSPKPTPGRKRVLRRPGGHGHERTLSPAAKSERASTASPSKDASKSPGARPLPQGSSPNRPKDDHRRRETSEERADRNRAEVKRELDEKKKAQPKKKRKF